MKKQFLKPLAAFLLLLSAVVSCTDHEVPIPEPTELSASNLFSGLRAPIGMEKDNRGNLWVSEIGTGNNDGAVVMISPDGTKTTFVSGFNSAGGPEGAEGISHLMFHDAKLYILHGIDGKLFIADVSGFKKGDPERKMSDLIVHEYGQLIRQIKPTKDTNSNLYAMTVGPDHNIYMVDAGANAVFKRDNASGAISLFASLPEVGTAPLLVDAVPTGIVFNGNKFLISTLSGGPFVKGSARIFEVDMNGNVSTSGEKYTMLTSITLTANNKPLALQFAEFNKGFMPFSGAVLDGSGKVLLGGLMMPTDIKRTGEREFYVLSMALGTVQKLTY